MTGKLYTPDPRSFEVRYMIRFQTFARPNDTQTERKWQFKNSIIAATCRNILFKQTPNIRRCWVEKVRKSGGMTKTLKRIGTILTREIPEESA